MNKENFLFAIIGLVTGLVIGFMGANSINRSETASATKTDPAAMMNPNAEMPPGHPTVSGSNPTVAQMENIPQVQEALQKAKAEPDNFDAQLKAAGFQYQIGKYEEAIETLMKANKLKPDAVDPIIMLGNAYFDIEKFEDAEKWYVSALEKKPNDIAVRTDLGLTFVLRPSPDFDRAIVEFKKSLEIDANHLQTLQNLTVAYSKKGDAANAKSTLAKVESLDPQNEKLSRLKEEVAKIGK